MTSNEFHFQSINSRPASRYQSTLNLENNSPYYFSNNSIQNGPSKPYLNKFLRNNELYTWRQTIRLPQEVESTSAYLQKMSRDSSRGLSSSQKDEEKEDYDPYLINNLGPKNFKNNRTLSKGSIQSEKSIKGRQKKERELQAIAGTFPTEQKIEKLDKEQKENQKLRHEKKKFSLLKLQMEILANKEKISKVQNFDHMSNQFDRKNLTINKIIRQVKPNDDLLSPEDVKWLTVKKIQTAIGRIKLHKTLKPSIFFQSSYQYFRNCFCFTI